VKNKHKAVSSSTYLCRPM